ncbi:Beta-lactamase domain-containing protein 2, partial [Nymphaea thermarum]
VCAYKDGEVIIDTAAGTLGRYDPRPVQPDSLFPVFSATKGITAGMIHWLVDNGILKLDENVASIWPDFGSNGKEHTKVFHVLNHTTGLHNAIGDVIKENPLVMCDWAESLKHIARATPETEPGSEQKYHYLSFGWICGGIIEHASGKRFQEILEEAIVHPLNIEGELYIGIPAGVESRLATLTIDTEDLEGISKYASMHGEAASLNSTDVLSMVSNIPVTFNMLPVRRAIIPAANGHCSARALARYYAALAAAGNIPPPHTGSDLPLGSHPHIPKFPSENDTKKLKSRKNATAATEDSECSRDRSRRRKGYRAISTHDHDIDDKGKHHTVGSQMFTNPRIHDAFMGVGEHYGDMVIQNGKFGLGFRRFPSGRLASFGHSGIGGSTGFCDVENQFAMAITVNKMSFGGVTRKIVQLVCSELQVPVPEEFSTSGERGPDMQFNLGRTAAATTA